MIERAIENWLTKTNERNYQAAFCQVLMHQGHRVLHSSSHGPMEQGKDIITVGPDGEYCGYQTKTGGIDLKEWREIRGEVQELVELPIEYPGVDKSKGHRAYLVANGVVTDPVRVEISARNEDNVRKGRQYAQLIVIAKDELLKAFVDAQGRFVPTELPDMRAFLEIYLSDGRAMLPKENLFRVLEQAAFAEKPTRKSDSVDAITGSLVITSYLLNAFEQAGNHYAMAEGWTVLAACMARYVLRFSVPESQWAASFSLIMGEIRANLHALRSEALTREDFLEGNPPGLFADGGPMLKARTTIVLGAISSLELDPEFQSDPGVRLQTAQLVEKHADRLWLWGESAFPYILHTIRFLEASGSEPRASRILTELFGALVDVNYKQRGPVFAPPYFSVEEILAESLPDQLESADYHGYVGSSFVLAPVTEMVARRNRRDLAEPMWRKLTHVHQHEFVPDREEDVFAWRTKEGANRSFFAAQTQSWAALQATSDNESLVPDSLKRFKSLVPYFLMVCPHRASPTVVRLVDGGRRMRIVILGWGSLIWDARDLPTVGGWQAGGPTLPIEFSRVSSGNRLTLVIDPDNGAQVPTQYIQSPRTKLADAIADLQQREGMPTSNRIGFVDRSTGTQSARLDPIAKVIEEWASPRDIDAVVWTDLPPNFEDKLGKKFTVDAAAAHIRALTGEEFETAMKYVNEAPVEVETPLRAHLRASK